MGHAPQLVRILPTGFRRWVGRLVGYGNGRLLLLVVSKVMLYNQRITYDVCELEEGQQALHLIRKYLDEHFVVGEVHRLGLEVAG